MKTSNFDSRGGFKAKVKEEDEASQEGEIEHRNAARQTRESIIRIAQNGFVEVAKKVNSLILARLFSGKVDKPRNGHKGTPGKALN